MKAAITDLILTYTEMLRDTRSKIKREILENVIADLERVLKEAQ